MKRVISLFAHPTLVETAAGAGALMAGALGVQSWTNHTWALASALQSVSPTYVSTAAALILCGIGMFATIRGSQRCATAVALLMFLLGCAELIEHESGLDFRIDQVLAQQPWSPGELHPGHMAAGSALCCGLVGFGLFVAVRRKERTGLLIAMAAAGVLSLSSVAIFGIVAGLPSFDLWHQTHMGLLSAIGFLAAGFGLLAMAWRAGRLSGDATPYWFPFFVGLGTALASLCLWQAVKQREQHQADLLFDLIHRHSGNAQEILTHSHSVLPEVVLGSGFLVAFLLPFVLYFAQSNWRRAIELERINDGLSAQILERQLAEERLSSSEERFRQLAASAQDAIIALDAQGKVVFWNTAAERIFGYTQSEVEDSGLHTLIAAPEHLPSADEKLLHFLSTGEGGAIGTTVEVTALRKGNVRFPVELSLSSFWSNGQRHALGLVRDITDRKQTEQELIRYTQDLEEARSVQERNTRELARLIEELGQARVRAEEASRAKGEFLASMSHEIRTPMNGIIGMSDLMLDTNLDHEQRDYLEAIRHSADALLTLVNDILDYSKVQSGKLVLENIPFDLESTLDDAMDLLAPQAHEKNLELILWRGPDAPVNVVGDPGRVRQIVLNLLGNAVKFTERGHVLLEFDAEDSGGIAISVRDTGVGIAPEKLPMVFQRFTQADSSTTRKYGGTGLGLAITKELVELMGGHLTASSEPGKGTALRVTLPLQSVTPEQKQEPLFSGAKALIVEHHELTRLVTADLCSRLGLKVAQAADGAEALRALSSESFDLALVDSMLPDMAAEEVVRTLRDASPRDLEVILLTSLGRRGDAARGAAAGCRGCLSKPLKRKALQRAVSAALRDRFASSVKSLAGSLEQSRTPQFPALRVLVAEDNAINQKLAITLLEKLGCRADVVSNGVEALQKWSKREYDAILMDCHMPEMDGLEATRYIRSKEKASGLHTPIIALTASAMTTDRDLCLAAGMDHYLSKPFRREDLAAVLTRAVEHRATASM